MARPKSIIFLQRINRTVTTEGTENLAARLQSVDTFPSIAAISLCRDAVSELSAHGDGAEAEAMRRWRMRFMAFGVDGKIDTTVVLRELPYIGKVVFPSWFQRAGLKALLWAMVAGFLLSIVSMIFSLSSVLVAFGISSAIGIIFGYMPAKSASRLNPIDALQRE